MANANLTVSKVVNTQLLTGETTPKVVNGAIVETPVVKVDSSGKKMYHDSNIKVTYKELGDNQPYSELSLKQLSSLCNMNPKLGIASDTKYVIGTKYNSNDLMINKAFTIDDKDAEDYGVTYQTVVYKPFRVITKQEPITL